MKFCKDCEYFKNDRYGYLCSNTMGEPDPVTGERAMLPCYVERGKEEGCGSSGKNFKPSLAHQFRSFILFSRGLKGNE